MKKNLLMLLMFTFVLGSSVSARTVYDNSNRILIDGTLRGQKHARAEQLNKQNIQAAAAAKINYDKADNGIMESNYYQDKNPNKSVKNLVNEEPSLKSNYYQDRQ